MSVQSILAIGNVSGYTELICCALMKGYQILYAKKLNNRLSFLSQENIRLVIMGNMTTDINPLGNPSLINFIESDVSVILAKENGLESPIAEIFQDQCYLLQEVIQKDSSINCPLRQFHVSIFWRNSNMPAVLCKSEGRKDIDNKNGCFLNGIQEGAAVSEDLIFRQEGDFISLKLDGDVNAPKKHGGIEKAIDFMEKHYNKPLSLNQIAQTACLSPYHFCRLFRKQVGTTCNKYLSILRVQRAKELLKKTDMSVTEISFKVGFNSLTHFERVFKRLEGTTPSIYR